MLLYLYKLLVTVLHENCGQVSCVGMIHITVGLLVGKLKLKNLQFMLYLCDCRGIFPALFFVFILCFVANLQSVCVFFFWEFLDMVTTVFTMPHPLLYVCFCVFISEKEDGTASIQAEQRI